MVTINGGSGNEKDNYVPRITALVRKYRAVHNEEESRDVEFRFHLNPSERGKYPPWGLVCQRDNYIGRVTQIYEALDANTISESDAIQKLTSLMEEYYGYAYPGR